MQTQTLETVRNEMDCARSNFRFHYQFSAPSSLEYKRAYGELVRLEREFNSL